jgi:hypothetical protein
VVKYRYRPSVGWWPSCPAAAVDAAARRPPDDETARPFGNATACSGGPMRIFILAITVVAFLAAPVSGFVAQDDDWRTIEIETSEVTAPDVTVSPDGEWIIFTMLGHLFRLPVEGGEAEQLTLKAERVNDRDYWTREKAKTDIIDYIERFYNRKRRHSYLGYVSPVEYELRKAA